MILKPDPIADKLHRHAVFYREALFSSDLTILEPQTLNPRPDARSSEEEGLRKRVVPEVQKATGGECGSIQTCTVRSSYKGGGALRAEC